MPRRKATRQIAVPDKVKTPAVHPPPPSESTQKVYQQPGQPQVYAQTGQQVYQQPYLYEDLNTPYGGGIKVGYVPPPEGFDMKPYAQAMYNTVYQPDMIPPTQVYQGQPGYQGQQPGYPQPLQTNEGPQPVYQGQQPLQTNEGPQPVYQGQQPGPGPQVFQGQQPDYPGPQGYQGQQPGPGPQVLQGQQPDYPGPQGGQQLSPEPQVLQGQQPM